MKKEKAKQAIKKFGSPLFVLDKNKLIEKFEKMNSAFKKLYPKTIVAYSYKTNYSPFICKTMHDNGAYSEVICGFEYELAKKLGVPGSKIIINGPYKPTEELEPIINDGCIINVDNLNELERINKIGKKANKIININMRINAKISELPWSKFGFNVETHEAFKTAELIKTKLTNINLIGIHMHIGTNITKIQPFKQAIMIALYFIKELKEKLSIKIEIIDLGGGFPSNLTFPLECDIDKWTVPDISEYAKAICEPLNSFCETENLIESEKPTLILEPGRHLVADAVSLLTSVFATKNIFDIHSVFIDAGVNILPSAYYRKHKIEAITFSDPKPVLTDFYGPLCMQSDLIETGVQIQKMDIGDILKIYSTGAYDFSQSIQFIRARPAMICDDGKEMFLIRKKETLNEIISSDCLNI
ncbi:MAG: alanine racemase [Candidatus Diapherotrites archaeon]|nr:alanine racemase [Candidatus Diapherotrites archaeon]